MGKMSSLGHLAGLKTSGAYQRVIRNSDSSSLIDTIFLNSVGIWKPLVCNSAQHISVETKLLDFFDAMLSSYIWVSNFLFLICGEITTICGYMQVCHAVYTSVGTSLSLFLPFFPYLDNYRKREIQNRGISTGTSILTYVVVVSPNISSYLQNLVKGR